MVVVTAAAAAATTPPSSSASSSSMALVVGLQLSNESKQVGSGAACWCTKCIARHNMLRRLRRLVLGRHCARQFSQQAIVLAMWHDETGWCRQHWGTQ